MWPWGHLGAAYLVYRVYVLFRQQINSQAGDLLTPGVAVAVAIGSQLPDLIDKPLAWTVTVLPSGRSLGHSLITIVLVGLVIYLIGKRINAQRTVTAFLIGWLSHSLSDLGPEVIFGLLRGETTQLTWTTYLLWPLLASPPYPNDSSFVSHFAQFELTLYAQSQVLVFIIASLVWYRDGSPGYRTILDWLVAWTADLRH